MALRCALVDAVLRGLVEAPADDLTHGVTLVVLGLTALLLGSRPGIAVSAGFAGVGARAGAGEAADDQAPAAAAALAPQPGSTETRA